MRILSLAVLALFCAGCARSPKAQRDRSLAAGQRFMQKKDYRRAVLEFKNAVQAMPRDAEAQYQLGTAFARSGDLGSAITAYKRASELNPKHFAAARELARWMATLGDQAMTEDAEKRLRRLLDVAPGDTEALGSLGLAELKLGQPEEAIEHLQDALAKSPKQLGSAVLLAQAMLAKKDVKGAERVLIKICQENPRSPAAYVVLGRFYSAFNRLAEAEQQYSQALSIQPQYAPALFDSGIIENYEGQKQQAEARFKLLSTHALRAYQPVYALFLFQEGRKAEAVGELERLYREHSDDRAARTRLVTAYRAVNRTADAEKLLTRVLAANSRDTDALLQRSRWRMDSGRYAEAQTDLNQALHENPALPEAHYLQAGVYRARGARLLEQQELNETLRLDPSFLPARLGLAGLMTAAHNFKSAMELLNEAPAAQKASLQIVAARNWALWAEGNVTELEKSVQDGLARQRTPDLLLQDALLKLGRRDFSAARASAEEALRQAPEDVRALEIVTRCYAAKDSAAAIEALRRYASQRPQSAAVQRFLGFWLLSHGDGNGARSAFLAAQSANPDSSETKMALAELDMLDRDWPSARQHLSSVLAQNPDNSNAHYWLAQIEEKQADPQGAIAEYRRVIAADSTNVRALNNLAWLLADTAGHADEALRFAQRAKELSPDDATVDDTLGWTLYRNGLYTLAIEPLEAANSRESTPGRICHLAMAYFKTGAVDRARLALRRAEKLAPESPELRQAQELLASAGAIAAGRN
jgi:tetratricopeptide (TPR) repeat protein